MAMKHKLDGLIEKHEITEGEDELLTKLKAHRAKIDQSIDQLKKESTDKQLIDKLKDKHEQFKKKTELLSNKPAAATQKKRSSKPATEMDKAREEAAELKRQIRAFE